MFVLFALSHIIASVFCNDYGGQSGAGGKQPLPYGGSNLRGEKRGGGHAYGGIGKPLSDLHLGSSSGMTGTGAFKPSGSGHGYFPSGNNPYGNIPRVYNRVADVAPLASSTGCPHGYMSYGSNCYLFSREKLTWFHAAMKCEYMGGYLAVANSAHENSYFKLMSAKLSMTKGVWLGLNDMLFPRTHQWNWGYSKKQCQWFDWGPKEPVFAGSGIRNCVLMWDSYDYCWKVDNCNARHYYICEYNPRELCTCNSNRNDIASYGQL